MLLGYAEFMSHKNDAAPESFGPRPKRAISSNRTTMNFRLEEMLRLKLAGLTAIENGVAKSEDSTAAHISDNAQLHYILEEFIKAYESKYGAIPAPDDEPGVQRHVRTRTK